MTLVLETIAIEVAGKPLTNFNDFSMTAGAEQAARTATCQLAGPVAEDEFPLPDMPAVIRANGETILTGYVRDAAPGHSMGYDGEIWSASVSFVSKSVDAPESSVLHQTGEIRNKGLLDVARDLESTEVEWQSREDLFDVPVHRVWPGASSFRDVEELARSRGVLIYDDAVGKINLAKKPAGRHAGGLRLGVNILEASATFSGRTRRGPVIVRGQNAVGTGEAAFWPEAKAENPDLGRPRPLVLLYEGEPNVGALQARAEQELNRREGRGRSASVTVPGWRDSAGKLWQSNYLVHVDDPKIFLDQDMLIQSVTFNQSPGNDPGTHAVLSLVDPRAMNGEDPKGKSDKGYKVKPAKAKVEVTQPPEAPVPESSLEPV